MNFELSTPNLPELEQILTNLLSKSGCHCHFINPSKTRILLWKEVQDKTEIYHLRIGIQKFISSECRDRNGEAYWKFEGQDKSKTTPDLGSQPAPTQPTNHERNSAPNHSEPN